ncbi:MAG: response regulator [Bacteriovorax sp.]|nr:response regulator [Bacteriovorax sp.]
MGIEAYLDKRVMIADDLPNMREDLVKILTNLGFTNIKEMPDGKAALAELKSEAQLGNPYDIIFSDINMPFMNGLDLLKALRFLDSYKKTPIFIVSTENEKDIIVKAILGGATDYIIKPYKADVVKEKILMRLK